MDAHIANIARKYFNPRTWHSGTEQMAPLLYAMIRMTRPATVVEYGAGYSTLFLLQALSDSMADTAAEQADLVEKTRTSGILERDADSVSWKDPVFRDWFGGGGRASATDAAWYLSPYRPHLYCFENFPDGHPYVVALRSAVAEAGLGHLFSLRDGAAAGADAIPEEARPVDFVWWDAPGFERCYRLFWPVLNPNGGTMIFHDVASGLAKVNWESFRQVASSRQGDCESLVLCQPNKLDQNSCAILRRTAAFAPPYAKSRVATQLHNARALQNHAPLPANGKMPESVG